VGNGRGGGGIFFPAYKHVIILSCHPKSGGTKIQISELNPIIKM
jgi:hypothetical protein